MPTCMRRAGRLGCLDRLACGVDDLVLCDSNTQGLFVGCLERRVLIPQRHECVAEKFDMRSLGCGPTHDEPLVAYTLLVEFGDFLGVLTVDFFDVGRMLLAYRVELPLELMNSGLLSMGEVIFAARIALPEQRRNAP